ncbi:diacylglycerol O-acyltransferase, putative [Babesia caballi]|uniref:Diacylglycerol O-acyltransferase, putative n=1 Tax=Babesia caballi TaxID=5871 RepID=A0AAV4M1G9_BABCB|nr:diacylglycerol O-acyltransferase, putative [Babesia caballi]
MANQKLEGICRNLQSAIDDTDALYKSVQQGLGVAPRGKAANSRQQTRFGEASGGGRKWAPPYTEPHLPNARNGSTLRALLQPERRDNATCGKANVDQNIEYMTKATRSDFFRSLNVDLEGWTEAQRQVFYNLVSSAERQMHAESERLQQEYSLQLESKLEHMRREMAEAQGAVAAELSELRVDRERLAFDDVDSRRRVKLTQESLHNLQKSYDNLMEECATKSNEIVRLNSVLAASERSFLGLKQRVLELESELNERLQQIDGLHQEVASAYKQMEAASANNAKSERALACTKGEIKQAQDQLADLRLEVESLQLNAQFVAGEKAALDSKVRSLEKEVSEMASERIRLESHIASLEGGTIASLKEQCKILEEQRNLARVETATCDKRHELAQVKRELDNLKYQCDQLSEDNRTLKRENGALAKQLESARRRAKDCENELFQLKCQAHVMRQSGYRLPQKTSGLPTQASDADGTRDAQETQEVCAPEAAKPARRDIFAPTMFDAPDAETQEQIDTLERELTELHLDKDRMESEMTRCDVGPKSAAAERRRHFLLERNVRETNQRIHELSEAIRKLQVPN